MSLTLTTNGKLLILTYDGGAIQYIKMDSIRKYYLDPNTDIVWLYESDNTAENKILRDKDPIKLDYNEITSPVFTSGSNLMVSLLAWTNSSSQGPTYDQNYYPAAFKSLHVSLVDSAGYPTLTKFYSEAAQAGTVVFEWAQENDASGNIIKWSVQNIA